MLTPSCSTDDSAALSTCFSSAVKHIVKGGRRLLQKKARHIKEMCQEGFGEKIFPRNHWLCCATPGNGKVRFFLYIYMYKCMYVWPLIPNKKLFLTGTHGLSTCLFFKCYVYFSMFFHDEALRIRSFFSFSWCHSFNRYDAISRQFCSSTFHSSYLGFNWDFAQHQGDLGDIPDRQPWLI